MSLGSVVGYDGERLRFGLVAHDEEGDDRHRDVRQDRGADAHARLRMLERKRHLDRDVGAHVKHVRLVGLLRGSPGNRCCRDGCVLHTQIASVRFHSRRLAAA